MESGNSKDPLAALLCLFLPVQRQRETRGQHLLSGSRLGLPPQVVDWKMLSVEVENQPPLVSLAVEMELDGEVAAEAGEVMLLLPSEVAPIGGEGTSHVISYDVADRLNPLFILSCTRTIRFDIAFNISWIHSEIALPLSFTLTLILLSSNWRLLLFHPILGDQQSQTDVPMLHPHLAMTGLPLSAEAVATEIGTEITEEEIETETWVATETEIWVATETETWVATEIEIWVATEGVREEVMITAGGAATTANLATDLLLNEDLTIVQGHQLKTLGGRSRNVKSIFLESLVSSFVIC